jgi:O-antigen biosynthesis protein
MPARATLDHPVQPTADGRSEPEGAERLVAPVAVRMFDLERPLEDAHLGRGVGEPPYRSLLAVVHWGDDPLGVATFSAGDTVCLPRERLVRGFIQRFGIGQNELATGRGGDRHDRIPHVSTWTPRLLSVVIATCGNAESLVRCIRSILSSDYETFEVVVADNRPATSDTLRALETWFPAEPRVRYVGEARRGASWARNAGLACASGDVIAFVDDDVVVQPTWLRASVEALTRTDDVACCTGLILPLELETKSQLLLEQFAAFGKGFQRRTIRLRDSRDEDPLFPYTVGSIGSGATMVIRADAIRQVGGFDTALGPGTPATGAEDLELLVRILRAGHAITYEPRAMVWHRHPDGMARLRRQAHRYGIGLGALLTKQALAGPNRADLLRAIPAGIRYLQDPNSRKNREKPEDFPRQLA